MARKLYVVTLDRPVVAAVKQEDVLETRNGGVDSRTLNDDEVTISVLLDEEQTVKLFTLARSMYESEKYNVREIKSSLRGLCKSMGCEEQDIDNIVEEVTTWCERFSDMDDEEFEEWLMAAEEK